MQGNAIETRRFATPDQRLDMKERGGISIVQIASGRAGMRAFSNMARPGRPTKSLCSVRPGKLVVRLIDTGIETRIGTGDVFQVPPVHDAYVEGADRVELILYSPPEHQH